MRKTVSILFALITYLTLSPAWSQVMLVPPPTGSYLESCKDCTVTGGPDEYSKVLHCKCAKWVCYIGLCVKGYFPTSLARSQCPKHINDVYNHKGKLGCSGINSTSTSKKFPKQKSISFK